MINLKFLFDFNISILLIIFFSPIIIIISIFIVFVDGFPVLYYSKRVGKNNSLFFMPKFRTMKKNTPQIATHLMKNPKIYLIPFASTIRKLSLDEFPQLYSVITGKMSLVGPRPALYNQYDLIELRNYKNINNIRPGITGYAQVNGRDNLSIENKVELDYYYLINRSFILDIKILIKTFIIIFKNKDVKH